MTQPPRAGLRQRLLERTDRLFAPRELLLRTDGRVAYFKLGQRQQKAAAFTLVGVILWAVLGTAGLLIGHSLLQSRDQEIARLSDAEARNRELQLRIARLRTDAEALAAARRRAATLAAERAAAGAEIGRLALKLETTQRRMAAVVEDRTNLQAARDDLAAKLGALKRRMAALQGEQQRLSESLTERMQANLDDLEETLAVTALDLDDLLARAGQQLADRGGPFVMLRTGYEPEPQRPASAAEMLVREIDRFERLQLLLRSLPLASPLDSYRIESGFGMRNDPFTRKPSMHEGIDMVNEINTPVLSAAPGVVVYAGAKGGFGRMVEIDHGFGISTRYGHLRSISANLGQEVEYRAEIGKVGSSGRSTGPHLHYEVRVGGKALDPAKFLEAGRQVFKGPDRDTAALAR